MPRPGRALRVIGLLVAVALSALLTPVCVNACDRELTLKQAKFVLLPRAGDPPAAPAVGTRNWLSVLLPDQLGQRVPGARGIGWYRFVLPRARRAAVCGVYLPHVHANAVLYLNGEWLGQGGRFRHPEAHTWNRPLYYPFDSRRLNRAENTLDVGVRTRGGIFHGIDRAVVGPDSTLRPRFERMFLLRVRAAELSTWLGITLFVLFGALGLALHEQVYQLLAIAAACYAINSLNYHWLSPPIDAWAYNTLVNLALQWMASLMGIFALRILGLRRPSWERFSIGFSVVMTVLAMALSGPTFERVVLVGHIPAVGICVAGFALIGFHRKQLTTVEWWIYLATATLVLTIGLHDLGLQVARQFRIVTLDWMPLMPLLGPAMLAGFGALLLARFLRIYKRAQRANIELQEQVAHKHAELQEHFVRVQELERQRAVVEERDRMTRDMHDGLGGQLVSMLAMTERGDMRSSELAQSLREALDEMRLVMQSLGRGAEDVPGMLAELRMRLEPRLRSLGLSFLWEVQDIPPLARLGPSETLQILRIVQECITNVIKHAGARSITVRTGVSEESEGKAMFVEVTDDGEGICTSSKKGRGVFHMRERAQRLGGCLAFDSSAAGTRVRLSIPLRMDE